MDNEIQVLSLFEGSPAYRKGVRRGDIIAKIEGDDTKGWTSDQAVRKLRGPKGTTVRISLKRQGYDQLIDLDVPRDEINMPSVPAAFMVNATTGYIRLQDFTETSDHDVSKALRDLSAKGMRQILLDLRGNPGGPLDQAIRVANEFLPKGDLIVYTKGRVPNSDQTYSATEDTDFTDLPLVVLVNRNSASASEIVSGALQDHDRGLIVGETTFGKALVQSIYRVSEGAGLALTTARYYTPSGRLIQRPWDGTFDEYLTYTLRDQNPNRPHLPDQLRYTDAHRPVYGGGGIEPDKRMDGPIEGFNPTRFGRMLYARQVFANYAQRFVAEGDNRISQHGKGEKVVSRNFVVDDGMLRDFKEFARSEKVKVDDEAFAKDVEFIKAMIHFEADVALFGVSEARHNLFAKDPQAQYAFTLFPDAVKLSELHRAAMTAKGH